MVARARSPSEAAEWPRSGTVSDYRTLATARTIPKFGKRRGFRKVVKAAGQVRPLIVKGALAMEGDLLDKEW
jgi:hypothetical protein